jgi:hypothetical protein
VFLAAERGFDDFLDIFLTDGRCNYNKPNAISQTPLYIASKNGPCVLALSSLPNALYIIIGASCVVLSARNEPCRGSHSCSTGTERQQRRCT